MSKEKGEIQYTIYKILSKNPRITTKKLFKTVKSVCGFKGIQSAKNAVNTSFNNNTVVGPYLYCNSGFRITLSDEPKRPPTQCIFLVAGYSYLQITPHTNGNLTYAELVRPSFPAKVTLEDSFTPDPFFTTCFQTPGALPVDGTPHWDAPDWDIYAALQNPRQSLVTVGKRLDISWKEVKTRFTNIVKDCKVVTGFFPLGYSNYSPLLLSMTSKYETGLRNWLSGLDRSSWLLKADDTLILYLYITSLNEPCVTFYELEQLGVIDNIRVAIPISGTTLFNLLLNAE
jgi:hypothetical protein